MGLFDHKKKKEKGVPFWKRGKETTQAEPIIEEEPTADLVEESEHIAEDAMRELKQHEQLEIEQAREEAEKLTQLDETRQEAIALARQAALDAKRAEHPDSEDDQPPEQEPVAEEEDHVPNAARAEDMEAAVQAAPEQAGNLQPEGAEDAQVSEMPDASESELESMAEPDLVVENVPVKKRLFAKLRDGLRKTKDAMVSRMQQVLGGFTKIDDELFDELEETMIMSDLGPETSVKICDLLRQRVKERGVTDPAQIMDMIQEIITEMLGEDQILTYPTKPTIVLVIGVNGAGKTTTIGKLCHQLKQDGKKVIVAAADTFRAAAIDQLEVWTNRAGVELVKHAEGSDPGAVVYDAIAAAKARDCDVLICDTAGRLHNKKNLMQELAKINRIITTQAEGCHVEVLLVLDATTGQNAVNQARLFQETADITGIVLTKLDGTAKGGIIVSIRNELGIPVKLVGVGEKIDDLQPFCGTDFVRALFAPNEEA